MHFRNQRIFKVFWHADIDVGEVTNFKFCETLEPSTLIKAHLPVSLEAVSRVTNGV